MATTVSAPNGGGAILSLQPPTNRLAVNTSNQLDGITLPVSSGVGCNGNIIICPGNATTGATALTANNTATLQQAANGAITMGAAANWNCQVC